MENLNRNSEIRRRGCLYIISAASGTGKTTLVQSLAGTSSTLLVSVSHTTRARRPDEGDGVAYHFIDQSTFDEMVSKDMFLEHAKVFDNYYGTSRKWVEQQLEEGKDIILEIDWQGAQQIRSKMKDAISIFLLPPSYESLKQRLTSRGGGDETVIKRRMMEAKQEISHYNEFDYIVTNDEFNQALVDLNAIIRANSLRKSYQFEYYVNFVRQLME